MNVVFLYYFSCIFFGCRTLLSFVGVQIDGEKIMSALMYFIGIFVGSLLIGEYYAKICHKEKEKNVKPNNVANALKFVPSKMKLKS
jgi:hypothetical protein